MTRKKILFIFIFLCLLLTFSTHKKIPEDVHEEQWHSQTIDWRYSAVDLSFLNSSHLPAGKHGVLKTNGDSLEFEDGTPAKFWGVNIQARALFLTSDRSIELHSKRLSRLGVNLVRIHHHDSAWVKPNIFGNQKSTLTLSPLALQKLDWWIFNLKKEGIYVWLDIQVGREYTKRDEIDNFSEVVKQNETHQFRGFNYYNTSVQKRIQEFSYSYLNHINQFTGLAYINDPAVVSVLLLNENDLSHHFGSALLPDKGVPAHTNIFMQDVVIKSEKLKLNPKKAWRTWEFGDPKIYLNDTEYQYYKKTRKYLRSIGLKSLFIPNNTWGGMSLSGLPSLTIGDIIDVHSYGRENELFKNPIKDASMLDWISTAQISGKPLSVSEWNVEKFPVTDRFTIPTWLASVSALQGWDAVLLYGYSQDDLDLTGIGRNYSTYNDPSIIAMMPAASLLYRQDHVSHAKNHYHLALNNVDFFGAAHTPINSSTLRTLTEQSKLTIDIPFKSNLPWLGKHHNAILDSYSNSNVKHHIISDTNINFIPNNQNTITSDTNELVRNWEKGIQQINTSKSQIINGNIGKKPLALKNTLFEIKNAQASIAVQSMDDRPIVDSNKILISKISNCQPNSQVNSAFICQAVEGKITIQTKSNMKLYELRSSGKVYHDLNNDHTGRYIIELNSNIESPWLVLSNIQE